MPKRSQEKNICGIFQYLTLEKKKIKHPHQMCSFYLLFLYR